MMVPYPYSDVGILKEIASSISTKRKGRPLSRHREPRDAFDKKKKAKKLAKASRRRNRR